MKKLLIVLIAVVAVGYLASPLVIGLVAREKFPAVIKAANREGHDWKAGKFDLGYLHSSAESTLTIPIAHHAPLVVHLHHKIAQRLGPDLSIMTVTTTPTVEAPYKAKVAALFQKKSPFVSHTTIYMDGHYTTTLDIPAVADTAVPGVAGVHVSFAPIHGTESGTFMPRTAKGRLTAPALKLVDEKDGVTFDVKGVQFNSDLKIIDQWLQVGKMMASADRITVTHQGLQTTRLDKVGLTLNVQREAQGIGVGYNIHIADFDSPGLKYKNLVVQTVTRRLDEKVLKKMVKRFATIGRRAPEPKQAGAMYLATFRKFGSQLLAHSPRFDIKRVAFDLPNGHVQLKANASFDGNGFTGPISRASLSRVSAAATADVAKGAYQTLLRTFLRPRALAYLKANKPQLSPMQRYTVSTQIVEKMAARTTQNLLQRHLLRRTKDGYSSHITFRNGALAVNGQTLRAASPQ